MISYKSVRKFCCEPIENIENYDKAVADTEHTWDCHHRNEICLANQSRLDKGITTRKQLIADGMYYNRPASELIFLRHADHISLHSKGKQPPDRSTSVEMTRISDGFTKVFSSQTEAAMWLANNGYPNFRPGHISCCCRGRAKTTGGCRWRYV